ncbi:MAG: hypothetical protein IJ678_03890 [Kiritimatiellae bacterium]|nr:hypothetical protein [Kiritimatiellia bacterium]
MRKHAFRPCSSGFSAAAAAVSAIAAALQAAAGSVVTADPGKTGKFDMTDQMKFVCNPNASVGNWSTSQARGLTTLYPYQGKIWTSGGDWYNNTGSSPVFAIDPATGSYTREYTAATETIWYFREGSDGSLYVPGVDQNESASSYDKGGAYFHRKNDGTWEKFLCNSNQTDRILRIPFGNIPQDAYKGGPSYEGMMMHTWDLANWKGKTFVCGYGIAWGEEGGYECMSNATAALTSPFRTPVGTGSNGYTYTGSEYYRRFESFLPFENDLFCFTGNAYFNVSMFDVFPFEEWRFNESTGQFDMTEVPWDDVAPGIAEVAPQYGSLTGSPVVFWQPTQFKGRVLYLVGVESTSVKPWYLCSATCENHHVKATRVDFGKGVFPFSISKSGDTVSVVAASYDSDGKKVINSVWESDDGLSFRRKFSFKAPQQASGLARIGDNWFFGMGWRANVPSSFGTLSEPDAVGAIYRIHFDHEYTPVALSAAVGAVRNNGSNAVVSVKVSCVDAASASLSLAFEGEKIAEWDDVQEGETYSATVETVPGRSYSFAFAATPSDGDPVTAAGAFSATAVEGWFSVDFADEGYRAGSAWTDVSWVSNPGGAWTDESGLSHLADASAGQVRRVELDGATEVVYAPEVRAPEGADVAVSGAVRLTAGNDLPSPPESGTGIFFAVSDNEIVPYGLANGGWIELDPPEGGLAQDSWHSWKIELDANSELAPRVGFSLDGEPLCVASGAEAGAAWIALDAAHSGVGEIVFCGDGAIGNFTGAYAVLAHLVLTEADRPALDAAAGLQFGTDPATGSRTFSATVANPVEGAWYTAFESATLDGQFVAAADSVRAGEGDDSLVLSIDAGADSKFMTITVSAAPFEAGDSLPAN